MAKSADARSLLDAMKEGMRDCVLLDVRTREEFESWHVPGAVNVPLDELESRLAELPADRDILTICAMGSRATRAAEILEARGFRVAVIEGGMAAWADVVDVAELSVGNGQVIQVKRVGKGCLSYLLASEGECLVVDPFRKVELYLELARERSLRIVGVIDTHLHADHISGSRDLANAAGAPLLLNPLDEFRCAFEPLTDGQEIRVGAEQALAITLFTPGHTNGSTCLLFAGRALVSGDTIFLDSVGRPDLAEKAREFAANLYDSLLTKLVTLDDDVVVLPAHISEAYDPSPGKVLAAR
jgi:glyoxylase-like metal-dependent hydrolase (beta-lactamase superfamily II)